MEIPKKTYINHEISRVDSFFIWMFLELFMSFQMFEFINCSQERKLVLTIFENVLGLIKCRLVTT